MYFILLFGIGFLIGYIFEVTFDFTDGYFILWYKMSKKRRFIKFW